MAIWIGLAPAPIVACDIRECEPGTCEHCDYERATGWQSMRKPTAPPEPLPIARVRRLGRIRVAIRFIRAAFARLARIARVPRGRSLPSKTR
jgi:hypothetical protein